jgi:hypothetical protein
MSDMNMIEAHVLREDGVETVPMAVTRVPGMVVFEPMAEVLLGHGDVMQWTYALRLCRFCGALEPSCRCDEIALGET